MTFPVSYIKPLVIKESMITSSTAVTKLAAEQEWAATTNYALGTIVTRAEVGGRRFENLIPGTNANKPEDDRKRWYEHGLTDNVRQYEQSPVDRAGYVDGCFTAWRIQCLLLGRPRRAVFEHHRQRRARRRRGL